MSDTAEDTVNAETHRLKEVDVLAGLCLLAAAMLVLVGLLSPRNQTERTADARPPVYYPVGAVETIPVTEAEPASGLRSTLDFAVANVIPEHVRDAALGAGAKRDFRQLPKTGPGFVTLLGDTWVDGHFFRSLTDHAQDFYGGRWAPENVISEPQGTSLMVRKESDGGPPFSIAEVRSRELYGYGRYEAVMQPGKGSGLVSAFFTYTGPYAGDPHDEIDIEFLGKDLTKIHFNYWRNGSRGAYATFDLPFDAGDAPHLYAFEWRPDKITWFVDGEVFHSTVLNDHNIPTTRGRLYFSHWTGKPGMQAWHGAPSFKSGTATTFSCVSYTPLGEDTRSCSDLNLTN